MKTPAEPGTMALRCRDLETSMKVMHAQKTRPKIAKKNPSKKR